MPFFTTLCSLQPGQQADGEAATLSIDAFVNGCMRSRSPAGSADVYALRLELDKPGDAVRHTGREFAAAAGQHAQPARRDTQQLTSDGVMLLANVCGLWEAAPGADFASLGCVPARRPLPVLQAL